MTSSVNDKGRCCLEKRQLPSVVQIFFPACNWCFETLEDAKKCIIHSMHLSFCLSVCIYLFIYLTFYLLIFESIYHMSLFLYQFSNSECIITNYDTSVFVFPNWNRSRYLICSSYFSLILLSLWNATSIITCVYFLFFHLGFRCLIMWSLWIIETLLQFSFSVTTSGVCKYHTFVWFRPWFYRAPIIKNLWRFFWLSCCANFGGNSQNMSRTLLHFSTYIRHLLQSIVLTLLLCFIYSCSLMPIPVLRMRASRFIFISIHLTYSLQWFAVSVWRHVYATRLCIFLSILYLLLFILSFKGFFFFPYICFFFQFNEAGQISVFQQWFCRIVYAPFLVICPALIQSW